MCLDLGEKNKKRYTSWDYDSPTLQSLPYLNSIEAVYKYILNRIFNLAFLEQIAHLYELNYAPS